MRIFTILALSLCTLPALAEPTNADQQWQDARMLHQQNPKAAIVAFDTLCTQGHREACADLGAIYDVGAGVERNLLTSRNYYERSCGLGQKWSCGELARLLSEEPGKNETRARELAAIACSADYAPSCYQLGVLNQYGRGGTIDLHTAVESYERACDLDFGDACNNLGVLAHNSGIVLRQESQVYYARACGLKSDVGCRNYAKVLESKGDLPGAQVAAERGCGFGDGLSCNIVGRLIAQKSAAPEQDALQWFNRACTLNAAAGCQNAASLMQGKSSGTSTKALELFEKACDLGEGAACSDLGVNLLAKNPNDAMGLLRLERACELKNAAGCQNYGSALVAQNPENALQAFTSACELGDGRGCYNQGVLLLKRAATLTDEGLKPLTLGCERKNLDACNALTEIYRAHPSDPVAEKWAEKVCAASVSDACR